MGVYIRVDEHWQPWANTVAYYPLTSSSTVNDLSGNSRNLTNTGVTFWVYQWVDCANMDWSKFLKNTSSYWLNNGSFTASIRCFYVYKDIFTWNQPRFYGDDSWNIWIYTDPSNDSIGYNPKWWQTTTSWSTTKWQLATVTYDGSVCKLYIDWVNVDTTSKNNYTYTDSKLWIGGYVPNPSYWKWWLSELILENVARTAEEITDYYNYTKSNYWIS